LKPALASDGSDCVSKNVFGLGSAVPALPILYSVHGTYVILSSVKVKGFEAPEPIAATRTLSARAATPSAGSWQRPAATYTSRTATAATR